MILNWFNIRKNTATILYSTNKVDKNLDVLNGVRVLSICWVVLGHTYMMFILSPTINLEDTLKSIKLTSMATIIAGVYSVDVFFCLSGFLSAMSLT